MPALTIPGIVIHCSSTIEGVWFDIEDVDVWHKQRGWKGCGYHFVIGLNGDIWQGRAVGEMGAHAKGYNDWVGVCYIGGLDSTGKAADTRTPSQRRSMAELVHAFHMVFGQIAVVGHRDLPGVKKACPCFDVKSEFEEYWTE